MADANWIARRSQSAKSEKATWLPEHLLVITVLRFRAIVRRPYKILFKDKAGNSCILCLGASV